MRQVGRCVAEMNCRASPQECHDHICPCRRPCACASLNCRTQGLFPRDSCPLLFGRKGHSLAPSPKLQRRQFSGVCHRRKVLHIESKYIYIFSPSLAPFLSFYFFSLLGLYLGHTEKEKEKMEKMERMAETPMDAGSQRRRRGRRLGEGREGGRCNVTGRAPLDHLLSSSKNVA